VDSKNSNIAIIVVYYGKWPAWINLFIKSCSYNTCIKFILFSENDPIVNEGSNLSFNKHSLNDFCRLASKKLDFNVSITEPYKVCDYKPAFGLIFEDYLKGFEYWGYCDIDLIFGDLSGILRKTIEKYDVVSGYPGYISGPFAVFRNSDLCRELFKDVPGYQEKLLKNIYVGFDEHIVKQENKGITIRKLCYFTLFFVSSIFKLQNIIFQFKRLKFQFQWYYKRITIKAPNDFSEIVLFAAKKNRIKVWLGNFITGDSDFKRRNVTNWSVKYSDGKLMEQKTKKQLAIFHFRESKYENKFNVIDNLNSRDVFLISKNGIKNSKA